MKKTQIFSKPVNILDMKAKREPVKRLPKKVIDTTPPKNIGYKLSDSPTVESIVVPVITEKKIDKKVIKEVDKKVVKDTTFDDGINHINNYVKHVKDVANKNTKANLSENFIKNLNDKFEEDLQNYVNNKSKSIVPRLVVDAVLQEIINYTTPSTITEPVRVKQPIKKVNLTDKKLQALVKERCKDCCPDGEDVNLCKSCIIKKSKVIKLAILKYCKQCRNGYTFDVCSSEDCPYFDIMPQLLADSAASLQGKK